VIRLHADTPSGEPHPLLADLLGDALAWVTTGALCSQADPEAWHPEKGGRVNEVKALCDQCPIEAECLQYALDTEQAFGVWGGLSATERKRLRSKKRRAA
jgi:WhiB family redox-sensing transcriptional regulator